MLSASLLSRVRCQDAASRPSGILFVLTDDQPFDMLGFMGRYKFLEGATPEFDRLREEGLHFANFFTTTSLCSPSRATLLTGTYAHRHGVWHNALMRDPPDVLPTFPSLLQKLGYRTAFFGKWHMRNSARPRPGFDHWLAFRGQGDYFDPKLNQNGSFESTSGYVTDLLTERAAEWLKSLEPTTPFCLILAHKAVHKKFEPAPRHRERFQDVVQLDTTDSAIGDPNRGVSDPSQVPASRRQADVQNALDQFRCLLAVDEGLGHLRETLQTLGRWNETLVVTGSDNGFFRGENNQARGKLTMGEPSIRVPFLMRYPPLIRPGSTATGMALNTDLAPTLVDVAGGTPPPTMQGQSLTPWFREPAPNDWRDAFLYEYFRHPNNPTPTILGVRTEKAKYVTYPDSPETSSELYDLATSPDESYNCVALPECRELLQTMKRALRRVKNETGFEYPPPAPATPDDSEES